MVFRGHPGNASNHFQPMARNFEPVSKEIQGAFSTFSRRLEATAEIPTWLGEAARKIFDPYRNGFEMASARLHKKFLGARNRFLVCFQSWRPFPGGG
jgi:hypothetical protein